MYYVSYIVEKQWKSHNEKSEHTNDTRDFTINKWFIYDYFFSKFQCKEKRNHLRYSDSKQAV